jgi:thiamine-monophosphate kinase
MSLPFGDDVAGINIGERKCAILKSDMLVDMTDAPRQMTDWQKGRKAVVATASDFASKGVKPIALLTSVGIPRKFSRNQIIEVAKGIEAGAKEYDTHIIGGDIAETSNLIIDCMGFGITRKDRLISRCGANPGDILAVTGHFGEASAGLKILLENIGIPAYLRKRLTRNVLMPRAQLKLGLALAKSMVISSSIDSSDGLAWSLYELSRMSGLGFEVNNLPVSQFTERFARLTNIDIRNLILYGGEEFHLVVTVPPNSWKKALRVSRRVGGRLYRIGRAISGKRIFTTIGGKKARIEPIGWEHFTS